MTTKIDPAVQWLKTHVPMGDSVLCATSGGLDSMCLAHLLCQLGYQVTIAHYHHGLRGAEADGDAAFVEAWSATRGLPFVLEYGDVASYAANLGLGIEEAGRQLRYAFLNRTAETHRCTWIATAHHGDDNVETMLLNLCRGTALAGLCGIPAMSGQVIRPLLTLSRADLEAYAQQQGISFVTDSTNADVAFARNRLRHQVLPVLKSINPQVVAHFGRTARNLIEEQAYLQAQAMKIPTLRTKDGLAYQWADLDESVALAHRAIHQTMCKVAGHSRDITTQHVITVLSLPRQGGQVSLPYGMVATSTVQQVFVEQFAAAPLEKKLPVEVPTGFGHWEILVSKNSRKADSLMVYLVPEDLTLTRWNPQDRMGSRSLKRRFMDANIAPAQRDVLPVVRCKGTAVAVARVGVHPDFVISREGTSPYYITFTYKGDF